MIAASGGAGVGWWAAPVLGIIEGLTEFVPVSSTGHLIVGQRLLGLEASASNDAFAIGIQVGAITAILVLYWRRLMTAARTVLRPEPGKPNLLWQIVIAAAPVIVVGLCLHDWIFANLFSVKVVAYTLILGGILLLVLERFLQDRPDKAADLDDITYRQAAWIGVYQCLALIPGTSRSGATIGGALVLGLSRAAAAEFSFLVGLPILYGASAYKLVSEHEALTSAMMPAFAIGMLVSFVAAIVVVRPFVAFLRRHSFAPFAWYRIVVGAALLAMVAAGYL